MLNSFGDPATIAALKVRLGLVIQPQAVAQYIRANYHKL